MAGLRATMTMDGGQFDATLDRIAASSAAKARIIQSNLSMKLGTMRGAIDKMPMGDVRTAAEGMYWEKRLALHRAGLQLEFSEQLASDKMTATARIRMRAANAVTDAYSRYSVLGGRSGAPDSARGELAQALRAQRAFRDFGAAAGAAHGPVKGLSLVMRETLVLFREIGRGNWARVPGSFTILLQGLRSMGYFLPALIGGAVIGGLALLAYHLHSVATRAKNLAEMLDPLRKQFREQADALRENASIHQGYIDWLAKVGDHTESLPDKIDKVIRKMREQASAEEELAGAKGANHSAILAMKKEELEAELKLLSAGLEQAKRNQDVADEAASWADQSRQMFDSSTAKGAKTAAENAGAILDAVQKKNETEEVSYLDKTQPNPMVAGGYEYAQRAATENDPFTVKVGEKEVTVTLARAKAEYDKATALSDALAAKEKELNDALTNTKTTMGEKGKEVLKLEDEISEIKSQLGLSGIRGETAQLQDAKQGAKNMAGKMNAQQRVGAFSVVPPDLAKLAHDVSRIAGNTDHLRPPAHSPLNNKGTEHGGFHQ